MFVGCRQALKWLRTKYRVASADTAASVVQAAATGVVDASYSADSDTARTGAILVPGSDDTDSPAVQVPARARTVEEIVSVVVEEKGWLDKVPTDNRSFDNAVSVIAVVSPWSLRRRRPCSLAVIIVQVASCASNGVALLIEGVTDELPAALDALVSRRMHKVGRQLQVTIGDRSIVLHPDFKMYLQVRQTSCVLPLAVSLHLVLASPCSLHKPPPSPQYWGQVLPRVNSAVFNRDACCVCSRNVPWCVSSRRNKQTRTFCRKCKRTALSSTSP